MEQKEIKLKETARFFKVLADEARLKMLWLLFSHRELCVCDIMAVLEITQSKASRHLAALRNAGLATDRKEGLWSYYSLRPVDDQLAEAHLKLLKANLSKRADTKQLLTKLNAWLKAKKSGETFIKNGDCARAANNAGSSSPSTYLSGGAR
jgi:ArsR family transcriptional regulator, arsenate/arsenite/antimonite-responsive transcriptional repressor